MKPTDKKKQNTRPLIGITMGCPVGVGPEVIAKFWAANKSCQKAKAAPVVIGDARRLADCARELSIDLPLSEWLPGAPVTDEALPVLSVSHLPKQAWAKPNRQTNEAMAKYILEAVRLTQAGQLAAMVTCPITKTGLQAAGHAFPGHTEMLATLCDTTNFAMMMAGNRLKVVLVTIHIDLALVPPLVTTEEVVRVIRLTGQALRRDFGVANPKIAVAGLNPHAGESGLFGHEEAREILPAIEQGRAEGWDITGPLPPDTVFFKAAEGDFDVVICMYHDQGLIPFKLLHFADGVNVTLGLPIIRTSVDHGTAYDIAGKGIADSGSLTAAFNLAGTMQRNRNEFNHGNRK